MWAQSRELSRVGAEVARTVRRQHGVIALRQLVALGISTSTVSREVCRSRLFRIHRGVYAPSSAPLSRLGRWMAAVLTYGPDAVLSHRSAAALRGAMAPRAPIHITVPGHRAGRDGIVCHTAPLAAADRDEHDRVPVTSVPRTLLDIAATEPQRLDAVIDSLDQDGLLQLGAVAAAIERWHGHPGRRRLASMIGEHVEPVRARSELERRFYELCRDAGLPLPEVNGIVAGLEVDFVWHRRRLVVETDGYRNHRSRAGFERDREREALLRNAGYDLRRFSWRQLTRSPELVLETTGRALGLESG